MPSATSARVAGWRAKITADQFELVHGGTDTGIAKSTTKFHRINKIFRINRIKAKSFMGLILLKSCRNRVNPVNPSGFEILQARRPAGISPARNAVATLSKTALTYLWPYSPPKVLASSTASLRMTL